MVRVLLAKAGLTLFIYVKEVWGQAAPEPARVAMETSIERQRMSVGAQKASIRKQIGSADAGEWFTIPWSSNRDGKFLDPPAPVEPLRPAGRETHVEPLPADAAPATPATPAPASTVSLPGCGPIFPAVLEPVITDAASANGYPASLLRSVIRRESSFDPCAVSLKGALGLMQLMPTTAEALGVSDPFDPVQSITAGARYLGELIGRYGGDWRRALGAYNAGPAVVDRYGGVPPYPETARFVEGVLNGQ
jgi:hypothetical protein